MSQSVSPKKSKLSCVAGVAGVVTAPKQDNRMLLSNVFEEQQKNLIKFVSSKISNSCDVDDLVQETFFQAYKSINTFASKAMLSTWIFGIALNLVKNFYNRSPEYRFQYTSSEDLSDLITQYGLPENEVLKADRFDQLQFHIARLPAQTREIVLLVAVDGDSYVEVAERLNLTVSTVKSRLHRARKQLRKELEF